MISSETVHQFKIKEKRQVHWIPSRLEPVIERTG